MPLPNGYFGGLHCQPCFTQTYFSTGKTRTKLSCKMLKKNAILLFLEFSSSSYVVFECFVQNLDVFNTAKNIQFFNVWAFSGASTWCHAYLSSQDWNVMCLLNEMHVSLHILMATYSPTHLSLKCFSSAKDLLLWGRLQWKKGSQDWDWETRPSLSLHCCSRSCRSTRPCRGTCERLDLAWAPSGGAPGTLPGWTDPQTLYSGH